MTRNQDGLHISQIKNKTAGNIVESQDEIMQDSYHNIILEGARVLHSKGFFLAEYVTSYDSGSSRWMVAGGENILVMRRDWLL